MHKFTLAFLLILLYIVLSTDVVRRFPADAVCRSDNRNSQKLRLKQQGSILQHPKERGI